MLVLCPCDYCKAARKAEFVKLRDLAENAFLEASGLKGGVSGQIAFQKFPQPLAIPEGAQARLDAQVKKLERTVRHVVDGLAGAYDVFKVPYITYSWGLDVFGEDRSSTFINITDKQCDDLIARFVDEFERLRAAADAPGFTVVWRMRPRFDLMLGDNGNGRVKLTTRLHF